MGKGKGRASQNGIQVEALAGSCLRIASLSHGNIWPQIRLQSMTRVPHAS
jgi:hypothetical protein